MSGPAEVIEQCEVRADQAGQRLDKAAAELLSDYSRAELSRWIQSGELTVDGEVRKPKSRVLGGERLDLRAHREVREPG